jgi:hypothetical protein
MFLRRERKEGCRGVLFSNLHPLSVTSHEETETEPEEEFEKREEEREVGVEEMWRSEVFHMQIS